MAEPRMARYKDIVLEKTVIGNPVVNSNFGELGKIEDLIVDVGTKGAMSDGHFSPRTFA